MDVEDFVELVDRQHNWLCDLSSIDGIFLDLPPDRWRRTTRADKRRYDEFTAEEPYLNHLSFLPSLHQPQLKFTPFPLGYRSPPSRVRTACRLFGLKERVADAAQKALSECGRHPELLYVAALVVHTVAVHLDWLKWMNTGESEEGDPETRWANNYREIVDQLQTHMLLCQDHKKAEWDRWRNLCTTTKRRDILDTFWLAKTPLSKSEIDPNAGTEFRRMMSEINKLAAMEKPAILWTIRADTTTQKWSKHWLGG